MTDRWRLKYQPLNYQSAKGQILNGSKWAQLPQLAWTSWRTANKHGTICQNCKSKPRCLDRFEICNRLHQVAMITIFFSNVLMKYQRLDTKLGLQVMDLSFMTYTVLGRLSADVVDRWPVETTIFWFTHFSCIRTRAYSQATKRNPYKKPETIVPKESRRYWDKQVRNNREQGRVLHPWCCIIRQRSSKTSCDKSKKQKKKHQPILLRAKESLTWPIFLPTNSVWQTFTWSRCQVLKSSHDV